ncbi:RNA methyltransferase OS=Streptomyces alboniger OX=132473 GN=CP975_05890 PE=4 SV=1 [Streptomyces alboniger]
MESVNDYTNIGAIFRSAAALGMDAVLLSPDCADPLYRRSVEGLDGRRLLRAVRPPRHLAQEPGVGPRGGFHLLALTPDAARPGPSTRRPRTRWTGWP